jgi:hypothetical protein
MPNDLRGRGEPEVVSTAGAVPLKAALVNQHDDEDAVPSNGIYVDT